MYNLPIFITLSILLFKIFKSEFLYIFIYIEVIFLILVSLFNDLHLYIWSLFFIIYSSLETALGLTLLLWL